MNESLILKSQDNKDVITFSNFKLQFNNVLKRVVFRIVVKHEIFMADTNTEAEEYDFLNLSKGLIDIYNNRLETYIFNPFGEQLMIKFNLLETGILEVELELRNSMFTGLVTVNFKSDITFIPYLVKNIDYILHSAKRED